MKVGVVVFPGSNCDKDAKDAITLGMGFDAVELWHDETDLKGVEAIILPGGFSYGDYLRSGALARFSPVINEVKAFADKGGPVLGICNGFQVLTESRLLPGALIKNQSLQFQCQHVQMTVENTNTVFTSAYKKGQTITLPIAHADGNFTADDAVIEELEANGQVVFRYTSVVNGAKNNIAGICNAKGNVLGMMPHPERNLWPSESFTGEGQLLFDSLKAGLTAVLSA